MRSLSILLLVLGFSSAWATPARVLIVRHAEKAAPPSDHLSEQGFQRAAELAYIFDVQPDFAKYGYPVALYATPWDEDTSNRTIETLAPLAEYLALDITTRYRKDQYWWLAQEILYDPYYQGQTVMIAWTHKYIPALAEAFGSSPAKEWPDNVYDRIWQIDFETDSNGQQKITSKNLPQNLLWGDSK